MIDAMWDAYLDLVRERAKDSYRASVEREVELGYREPPDDWDDEREVGDLESEEEGEE